MQGVLVSAKSHPYRHALLKHCRPMSDPSEREPPVPPVLSRVVGQGGDHADVPDPTIDDSQGSEPTTAALWHQTSPHAELSEGYASIIQMDRSRLLRHIHEIETMVQKPRAVLGPALDPQGPTTDVLAVGEEQEPLAGSSEQKRTAHLDDGSSFEGHSFSFEKRDGQLELNQTQPDHVAVPQVQDSSAGDGLDPNKRENCMLPDNTTVFQHGSHGRSSSHASLSPTTGKSGAEVDHGEWPNAKAHSDHIEVPTPPWSVNQRNPENTAEKATSSSLRCRDLTPSARRMSRDDRSLESYRTHGTEPSSRSESLGLVSLEDLIHDNHECQKANSKVRGRSLDQDQNGVHHDLSNADESKNRASSTSPLVVHDVAHENGALWQGLDTIWDTSPTESRSIYAAASPALLGSPFDHRINSARGNCTQARGGEDQKHDTRRDDTGYFRFDNRGSGAVAPGVPGVPQSNAQEGHPIASTAQVGASEQGSTSGNVESFHTSHHFLPEVRPPVSHYCQTDDRYPISKVQSYFRQRTAEEEVGDVLNTGGLPTLTADPNDYWGFPRRLKPPDADSVEMHPPSGKYRGSASTAFNPLGSLRRSILQLKEKLKHPKPYKPQLTSRQTHGRDQSRASQPAGLPLNTVPSARELTSDSRTSNQNVEAVEQKFKEACSRLEILLSEALAVAIQVAEEESERHAHAVPPTPHGHLQLHTRATPAAPGADRFAALPSLPSIHESLGSQITEKDDGASMLAVHVPGTPRDDCAHPDDKPHRCLLPGFHHGDIRVVIPQRQSSLRMRDDPQAGRISMGGLSGNPRNHNIPGIATETFPSTKSKMASKVGNRGGRGSHSLNGTAPDVEVHDSQNGVRPLPTQSAEASAREFVQRQKYSQGLSLRGKSYVSLQDFQGFSLAKSHRRHGTARDWSTQRKRFVAAVACISTAVIGIIIGIYAGLVPAIQYYIADLHHYAILGNVFFYLGLAVPSFLFWPLPLLHGRKPYILSSLVLAMPLLFPQAIAVSTRRSPYVSTWRWCLLGSRAFMGLTLGFASMNFHAVLTDLFGASLVSGNPHQELVDTYDVRRHGGGMGVWLGIWTWCFLGSLGVGFLVGAAIINTLDPSWGFYVSIVIIAVALLLNVVCPEVRRSPFRRSVAEVRVGTDISRRVARGEIMMHRVKTGPKWWGQEVYHGVLLSLEMMRQPGFAIMAVYVAWTYYQFILIIVLLGSLTSRYYRLQSTLVGACVSAVALGGLISIPFQKANVFSRARHHQENMNKLALEDKLTWTSHFLRRLVFTSFLPLVGVAYTAASTGPPTPVAIPTVLAGAVGFLSCLAVSECNGLIMETFDCSDLQSGSAGRSRSGRKRTNYSSFPRVTSAFAICHALSFVLAAAATWLGGSLQRRMGQRAATGVVAAVLAVLSLLLSAALIRFRTVRIVPQMEAPRMEKWADVRRESFRRRSQALDGIGAVAPSEDLQAGRAALALQDAEPWRPVVIGSPMHATRRVNVLEMGAMTRWSEIRRKNHLVDVHVDLNRKAIEDAVQAVEKEIGVGTSKLSLPNSERGPRRSSVAPDQRGLLGKQQKGSLLGQTLMEEDEHGSEEGEDNIGYDEEYDEEAQPNQGARGDSVE